MSRLEHSELVLGPFEILTNLGLDPLLKDVTYIKFVASVRTEKDDPNRIRATLGGNLIHYPKDICTLTATPFADQSVLEQCHLYSMGLLCQCQHLHFLSHDLKCPEYAKVCFSDIPDKIIEEYKLKEKSHMMDGFML